jgi:hypothetical protein
MSLIDPEMAILDDMGISTIQVAPPKPLISTSESSQQDEKNQNERDSCRYSDDPFLGSPQESDEICILCGFLKSNEFGFGECQSLCF